MENKNIFNINHSSHCIVTMIVIGAGPAGLLTSILLKQHGFNVDLYDKRPSLLNQQIPSKASVNITICARGLKSLEIAKLSKQITPLSKQIKGVTWHQQSTTFQPYGSTLPQTSPHQLLSIKRYALTLLLEKKARSLGVKLHFRHKLMHINPTTGTARFQQEQADGTTTTIQVTGECIIGADGCYSTVRKCCFTLRGGQLQLAASQKDTTTRTTLQETRKRTNVGCVLEEQSLGYIEITTPPIWGNNNTLHVWNRSECDAFILGLPSSDNTTTLGIYANNNTIASYNGDHEQLLTDLFPTLSQAIADSNVSSSPSPSSPSPSSSSSSSSSSGTLVSVSCASLAVGKVVLIGDAAHSMLPFCGQGCNSALEDARILCECLIPLSNQINKNNKDTKADTKNTTPKLSIESVLLEYSEIRHQDVECVVELSRKEIHTLLNASVVRERLNNIQEEENNSTIEGTILPSTFDLLNFTTSRYTSTKDLKKDQSEMNQNGDGGDDGIVIHVKLKDIVQKNQPLATIEMLKTRRIIRALHDGIINTITYKNGIPTFELSETKETMNEQKQERKKERKQKLMAAPISTPLPVPESVKSVQSLKSPRSTFSPLIFQRSLNTTHLGRCFTLLHNTKSTMIDVANEAQRGAPTGTVVMSEMQTAGRGRGQGRKWESQPKGNLYFTILLRPPIVANSSHDKEKSRSLLSPDSSWMRHIHYSAVTAVTRALRRCGIDARIKFPNDVWVKGKKISGMLIDITNGADDIEDTGNAREDSVSVGIGINVHENMMENETVQNTATSLSDVLKAINQPLITRESLLADVLNLMEEHLLYWKNDDKEDGDGSGSSHANNVVLNMYKCLDVTLGNQIEIRPRELSDKKEMYVATAIDIDPKGRLIIQQKDGTIEHISSQLISVRPNNTNTNALRSVIYIYNDKGTTKTSPCMVRRSFLDIFDSHKYDIQYISAIEICNGRWRKGLGYKKVSGLVFPGGADRHYMKELEAKGGNVHIKEYVEKDGGIYIGFCAGAYYGCKSISFDLGGKLEVEEKRTLCFYKGSGVGPVFHGFEYDGEKGSRAARVVVPEGMNGDKTRSVADVYYNGGCTFEKGIEDTKVKVTSYYESLNEKNKKIASLEIQCEKGTAILCGVHPEYLPHQMIGTTFDDVVNPVLRNDQERSEFLKHLLQPIFRKDLKDLRKSKSKREV